VGNAAALQKRFTVDVYPSRGLVIERGEGVYLFSESGERYLDLMSNYGASILGYGHPVIERALVEQWRSLPTLHGSFANEVRARASQALVARAMGGRGAVYWGNSGAEAVEAALKLAALVTGKRRFVACRGGYHGKTLGALSATWGDKYRKPFEPLLWRFEHVPFDDAGAAAAALDGDTAAMIVEPIQGESGVSVPRPGYLAELRRACSERGVLLVLDEVQTGCGRTGAFLAAEHEGVRADVVCLGKGLAGGIPIGATVVTPEIAAKVTRGAHTSTFGGNPLALAGVLAVLSLLDAELLAGVAALGERFRAALRDLGHPRVVAVRGRGVMIGVEVDERRDEVLRALQERHVLAAPAGERVVRFLPPYLVTEAHLDEAVSALAAALDAPVPAA
jgi:acetylornithine/succinyldiaminopimelate/putrescine aminotransferase